MTALEIFLFAFLSGAIMAILRHVIRLEKRIKKQENRSHRTNRYDI